MQDVEKRDMGMSYMVEDMEKKETADDIEKKEMVRIWG